MNQHYDFDNNWNEFYDAWFDQDVQIAINTRLNKLCHWLYNKSYADYIDYNKINPYNQLQERSGLS